jgi:predicted MFS family arabinose efflux permease
VTTAPSARQATATGWNPRQWALLLVLAGNMLIDALEVGVMLVAAPSVAGALGLGADVAQWLLSGFALGFGVFLLVGVQAVERHGRRTVYLWALFGFALASVAAGLAGGPIPLAVTRVVKGACAALTAPTGLAIIGATFPAGAQRARAVAVYSFVGAAGLVTGLLAAGGLTLVSWRLALAFPGPAVLVLLLAAALLIPRDPRPAAARPYDRVGVALLGVALVAAVLALSCAGRPASWGTAVWSAVAVLAAAALVPVERATQHPLLPADLLRDAPLRQAAAVAAALNGGFVGTLFVVGWTLHADGWGSLRVAVGLLPAGLPLLVTVLRSSAVVERIGTRRAILAGACCTPPAGLLLLVVLPGRPSYPVLLPVLLLAGTGLMLAFTALNLQAVAGSPPERRPLAGATYQTAVQIGAALTLAAVGGLLARDPSGALAAWPVLAVALLGFAAALARPAPLAPRPSD